MPEFSTRPIGNTSIAVTELGLGCAAMAGNHRPVEDVDIAGAIDEALENKVGYVDTAPFYGFGRSEHFVGNGLRHRDDYVLSTKAGRLLAPGFPTDSSAGEWPGSFPFHQIYDYSYEGVMRSYEDSLQRLGVSRIDILLLHDIGAMQHGEEANRALFNDAMTGGYRALDELRRAGDIKAIGLGVNEQEVCLQAMEHGHWDAFLLAGRYTLLEQAPLDKLFPACAEAETSIILGGPFNSGILVGGETWNYAKAPADVVEKVRRINEICQSHGVPLPAAALQFPLGATQVASVIPGPRSRSDMRQILDWFQLDIPASLWSDLQNAQLLAENAPLPG
ncbi:aldo/keto reductase [Granulosicoccus antarcticus]|uniref:Pyridoxal 4-dehydrogenase n=1 Tax=Granulosicoccus antarcticus IMCC3135 TaxID=1192854 RepID=A0A2Z2NZP7_9GAMM|nr:aldo/keto reductase [Granulosicoccus antarcticus]ASJ72604.1 Pyridoxal 4-dehydrogenase [Granulosicoccus antarcticus IMCC3135]